MATKTFTAVCALCGDDVPFRVNAFPSQIIRSYEPGKKNFTEFRIDVNAENVGHTCEGKDG